MKQNESVELVLFCSTGRCGTKFLSNSIVDSASVVVHEYEVPNAKFVMEKHYIPLSISGDIDKSCNFLNSYKIPQILNSLREKSKSRYIDTGHQINFGTIEAYVKLVNNLKIIRLRRDRYETMLSFLTTDPKLDIWNVKDYSSYYRWMLSPQFRIVKKRKEVLKIWDQLSRPEKILWAIDEVERQWQYLLLKYNFSYLEYSFDDIRNNKFGKLENYLEVKVIPQISEKAKNSSKFWKRDKPKISRDQFEDYDNQLKNKTEGIYLND